MLQSKTFRNFALSIAALILFGVTTAKADTVSIVGVDSGGFSTATLVCEFNSQTNTFTFTITNTSNITQPGSTSTITALGFDLSPLSQRSGGCIGSPGFEA
jgi:hypothetical protein